MIFSLIVMIAVAIAAVLFASYNPTIVQVSLFGYMVAGPLGLFLIIALGIGVLIGVILMTPSVIKHKWSASRRQNQIKKMEQPPAKPVAKTKSAEE